MAPQSDNAPIFTKGGTFAAVKAGSAFSAVIVAFFGPKR
jgi:hypothetical protein